MANRPTNSKGALDTNLGPALNFDHRLDRNIESGRLLSPGSLTRQVSKDVAVGQGPDAQISNSASLGQFCDVEEGTHSPSTNAASATLPSAASSTSSLASLGLPISPPTSSHSLATDNLLSNTAANNAEVTRQHTKFDDFSSRTNGPPPSMVYRQVSKTPDAQTPSKDGASSNNLVGGMSMARQISKADTLDLSADPAPSFPISQPSSASGVPVLGRQVSKAGALNEHSDASLNPASLGISLPVGQTAGGVHGRPPAYNSFGAAPMPINTDNATPFLARQVSKSSADTPASTGSEPSRSYAGLGNGNSVGIGAPAVVFSPSTAPLAASGHTQSFVPFFDTATAHNLATPVSSRSGVGAPSTPTSIQQVAASAAAGAGSGGLGLFRQDSIGAPEDPAPLPAARPRLRSASAGHAPINVMMIGTGEYTTGYVHGHQSGSDKGAGVVALTMCDLQRRNKLTGQLSLCGVNGNKFPGIRAHLQRCISDAYAGMQPHIESIQTYPADDAVDSQAYLKALESLSPGDAVIVFTPDNTHFEVI
jgi:hypothetical protein